MKIYLDFDGTVTEHAYPEIGRYNPRSLEVVKKLQDVGHEIILNTYRANLDHDKLQESLDYVNSDGWLEVSEEFELDYISATSVKLDPHPWNLDTALERGVLYIDDIAHKIPLIPSVIKGRNMVDWNELDWQFMENGFYN
jgi:hypothetical protein